MNSAGTLISVLTSVLPIMAVLVAVLSMFVFLAKGSVRFGSFRFEFEKSDKVRQRIAEDIKAGTAPQIALMQEYHAQGLSQSRISFWFSLVFASLGFAIIALSIGIFLQGSGPQSSWLETAGKPLFTLIAGTIIDAVSALFFVQSNKARQLMTEFFDKLRVDRKLDEALNLMKEIEDPTISNRIRGIIALTFSSVPLEKIKLSDMLTAANRPPATRGEKGGEPTQPDPAVVQRTHGAPAANVAKGGKPTQLDPPVVPPAPL
jgi:hypothetical protein